MHKEKRTHRETRLQIINKWADKGLFIIEGVGVVCGVRRVVAG